MTDSKRLGKYEILEEMGHGGFAVVYKARDTRMGREVALKVLRNVPDDESTFVQRLEQEARTAAGLRHSNIVPVYDFGDVDGTLYIAMALIDDGRTLRSLMDKEGPLPLEQALPILAHLANALDYLHERTPPLVHRDLKPTNVLLEGEGDNMGVVLTDFGLVCPMEASTELTKNGTILGTFAYLAPEQADPGRWGKITPLTDVYALGVIAYEMLVGRQPFVGELVTMLRAHAYEEPPSPSEINPHLDADLSAALLKALAKPPTERYANAGMFVAALQDVIRAQTAAAERIATLGQLEVQAQKRLDEDDWLEVIDCCTQMLHLDPDRPTALEMLTVAKEGLDHERAEAIRRRRLEERYSEGVKMFEEEKWKPAIAAFEEVFAVNPDFREVQNKLAQAQDELQCAQWYDEAIAHCESERWVEACRTWAKVLRGRLGYRNGDAAARLLDAVEGLLGQLETVRELFNNQQRALDRATEALYHYDTLAVAMEEEQWDKAIKAAERLSKLVPDLKHVQSWPYVAIKRLIEAQGVDAPAWLGSEGLPSGEEAVAWLEQLAARQTSDGGEKAEGRTEPRMERTTRDLGIEHRQT